MMTSAISPPLHKREFSILHLILVGLILFLCSGCHGPSPPRVFSGTTMGTTWTVKLVPPNSWRHDMAGRLSTLDAALRQELEAVNNRMSVFREQSEISRFNRFPGLGWFAVSRETADLVATALDVYHESNGAFDVTVGPVIRLWGFGPEGKCRIPEKKEIDAALAQSGSHFLDVRVATPALRKKIRGLECNLSALAKGHGVDRLTGLLDQYGVSDYLVEIGGEVRVRGERSGGGLWRIGVMEPFATGGVRRVVALKDLAMATSGDYQNYFEVEGVRYSHTMDPRTGRPVTHDLASVTVVAETCMLADAWATALLVMGPAKARDLAESRSIPALFIQRTDTGFSEYMTPPFRRLLSFSGRGS